MDEEKDEKEVKVQKNIYMTPDRYLAVVGHCVRLGISFSDMVNLCIYAMLLSDDPPAVRIGELSKKE